MKKLVMIMMSIFLICALAACSQTHENNKKKLDEKVFTQGQVLAQYYYKGIHGKDEKTAKIKTFQQHFKEAFLSDQYDSEDQGVFILTIASLQSKYEHYQQEKKQETKKEIQNELDELHNEFGIIYSDKK